MTKGLLIIDMQQMMQHRMDEGRPHVNGSAADRITELAAAFRGLGLPVIHIRHREEAIDSPLHPDAPGFPPMPCGAAEQGEAVFYKSTSSGFASTDLAAHLRQNNITELVTTGAVAGFCVTSTVRSGADLGFDMTVVSDAVLQFSLPDSDVTAQEILRVTLALLGADFAQILSSEQVLAKLA